MLDDKRFEAYYDLLIRRNNEFNLTAITEKKDVWVKHFADSVSSLSFIPNGATLIDIGSGAGFPGIPIKIAREDIKLTMVESIRKKADFLKEAVILLKLTDTEVINKRAEELPKDKLYDCGTARAVAKTVTLCEYILPFIKIGGIMIAYKSKDAETEAKEAEKAIEILGGKLEHIEKLTLDNMERNLLIIRKLKPTPQKYPRSGNKPKLSPIM